MTRAQGAIAPRNTHKADLRAWRTPTWPGFSPHEFDPGPPANGLATQCQTCYGWYDDARHYVRNEL